MILANLFVVVGIYVLSSLSFNSSFREYLDANRVEKLTPMAAELSVIFQQYQHWEWVREPGNESWRNLIEEYVLDGKPPRDLRRRPPSNGRRDRSSERPRREAEHQRPKPTQRRDEQRRNEPRHPPRGFPPGPPAQSRELHILLADSQRELILGRPEEKDNTHWLDINVGNETVGYLGFVKTKEITSELDRLFIDKIRTNLGWSVAIVIIVTALITLVVTKILVTPILKLRTATKSISDGNYETRIAIKGQDEIGELCKDFNHLAGTLKSNLEARQQWIADISHELRTPVAILQGELEALQDGVREFSMESVDSLHQEIKRLGLLINDLHELSLSDSGALSYHFEKIELTDLVQKTIELKSEAILLRNFSLENRINNSLIYVNGDSHRLTQLFLNLLNNSLAYSKQNGRITIDYSLDKNAVTIEWADSEPGVSDEQLRKLFDRLYRAEGSRNRNSGGSGLGLSISKNIVEAHGGDISVEHSTLGGVLFKIRLPIC